MITLQLIGLFLLFIMIFHIIRSNIKIKKKDIIHSQTEKYKRMMEEITQQPKREKEEEGLEMEQRQMMEYELNKIIENYLQC
jgi:hypothetical protein